MNPIERFLSAIRGLLRTGRARQNVSIGVAGPPHTTATGATLKEADATWTLTGPNTGSVTNLPDTFAGTANLSDTSAGTLKAKGATWTLTGPNTGSVTNLSGTFAGMTNLSDTRGGTLKASGATWTLTGPNTGSVSNLSGTFAGMVKLSDKDEENVTERGTSTDKGHT